MTTEGERLAKLENQMDNIEKKVDDLTIILTNFIENSEKKYAGKWVERFMVACLSIIVFSAIATILIHVFPNITLVK